MSIKKAIIKLILFEKKCHKRCIWICEKYDSGYYSGDRDKTL